MLGGLGAPELIVIALIALLLFGAGRIADIGKGLGQGIKNFKEGIKEADKEDDEPPAKAEKSAKAKKAEPAKSDKSDKSDKKEKEEAAEEA